jgi:hypothetical protein
MSEMDCSLATFFGTKIRKSTGYRKTVVYPLSGEVRPLGNTRQLRGNIEVKLELKNAGPQDL